MRNPQLAIALCLVYALGLIATCNPWVRWGLTIVALPLPWLLPKYWAHSPNWKALAAAIAIFIGATFYLDLRVPHPAADDISKFISGTNERGSAQFAIVRGTVDSYPRLTRSQNSQFWLKAKQLNEIQGDRKPLDVSKSVSGLVYVTVPLQSATGLQPGVEVTVTGTMYLPAANANPGGFSFRDYLQQSGGFAGMRGGQLQVQDENQTQAWSWGKLRQRIAAAQVRWLDVPIGPLVTAMALGTEAVDLPFDVRDRFVRVGLAHILAASGFQVSLILNTILSLTRNRLSVDRQVILGAIALLVFLLLAGFQPAVARAVFMGAAVLVALKFDRQIEPLNSLLLAGTILLLINPLWIWDVGFELSFLATLGLIVTAKPVQDKLDWLPPTIASAIAVPLAASIWTLPVQLFVFKVFPLYSLPANILVSPLVSLISIGGTIGALVGAIVPIAGSAISWLLYLPAQLLIWLVELFNNLPFASFAVGQIGVWQLILLYGIIIGVWLVPRWQIEWRVPAICAALLVLLPLGIGKFTEFQITVLASKDRPVLVFQDRGRTLAIDTGNESTTRFIVVPFLQQQAISSVDRAVDTNTDSTNLNSWQTLSQAMPIWNFYSINDRQNAGSIKFSPLPVGKTQQFDRVNIKPLKTNPAILKIEIPDLGERWISIGNNSGDAAQSAIDTEQLFRASTLIWGGGRLSDRTIAKIRPKVAIAAGANPDLATIELLEQNKVRVYYTDRDGAIQWTPDDKFKPFLEGEDKR